MPPKTEEELKSETAKWLEKLEVDIKTIKIASTFDRKATKEAMENVRAYIKDCKHFSEKGDLTRAFEAIVYAWGIYETLLRMGLITVSVEYKR